MKSIKEVYKIGSGPSSSHTMGPELATIKLLEQYPNVKSVICNLYGSLALTGKGHLTDYIIEKTFGDVEIKVNFLMTKRLEKHENGMEFFATLDNEEVVHWIIYSIGGGDIVIEGLEGAKEKEVYPHNSMKEIRKFIEEMNISYFDYVMMYEPEVIEHMKLVWTAMKESIERGIKTQGLIPGPLKLRRRAFDLYNDTDKADELLISAYAHAVNEENASGGKIVTAPTCGACGVLPAVLKFYQDQRNLDDTKIYETLCVAGLFGNIVKTNASISGAEAGCQAEVGTATSMAAAAIAYIKNKNSKVIEAAAEIAMEHQLGLTCDPIMGFVQIPCIQRNAVGAIKAKLAAKLANSNSALDIVDFDTVVKIMFETGKDLSMDYRETASGGLAKFYKKKAELEK